MHKNCLPSNFNSFLYKKYNPDLFQLNTEEELQQHYIHHGFFEKRIYELNLPEDFCAINYKKYNQDLLHISSEFELQRHYLMHGQHEGRIYKLNHELDFNLDVYKACNSDLINLSTLEIEKHFNVHGKNEDRPYKDIFFDKNFFIKENNILNFSGYEDYLKDIRKLKSLDIKNLVNKMPYLHKNIILVSHKASFNGATHSLYILANFLKENKINFTILDTDINLELIKKYNLSEEDVISYYNDPTLLYWWCTKINSNTILFNSVNFAMSKVYEWLDHNKIILFSREIRKDYEFLFKQIPDFVITNEIKKSYFNKPNVQTPILPPFLQKKIDEELNKDVFVPNLNLNKITIGMCGSLGDRKNYNLFLEVAQNLPLYNFLWIGGKNFSSNLANVFHIEEETYPYKYYKLLDYFVLFSKDEPFGNVVIENLYAGNKVLTFKKNIFYKHKNSLLKDIYFEFNGEINLKNAIKHILKYAVFKKKKIDTNLGKHYVTKHFSTYSKKFLNILLKKIRRGVDNTEERKNLKIECDDGFANQIRLALAGDFLANHKYIESYSQKWILNNHNNVNFLHYFNPLPNIKLVSSFHPYDKNIINTTTFKKMIYTFIGSTVPYQEIFNFAIKNLQPLDYIKELVDIFCKKNNLHETLGLHVRKTCKIASLKNSSIKNLTNEEYLNISKGYKKVFLSTDNKETQDWFKEKLQDKLIVYQDIKDGKELFEGNYRRDKVVRYTDPLHTVMDLLILLKCNTFIGTCNSSFSLLILHWRNNEKDFKLSGNF